VIFLDIAGFKKRGFLHIISINLQLADIWFQGKVSVKISSGISPQDIGYPNN